MKKPYSLRPLAIEEMSSNAGFTHDARVTADDLTTAVANTAQTLKLGGIPQFAVLRKVELVIRKPFRNKADTAFNSLTLSLGDQANGATQFLAAKQANANNNITFNDGVTNTDTSLVSASAAFVAGDVGKTVTGAGIPAGTTIASRTNATTVVLSAATTATATSVSITIGGRVGTPVTTPRFMSSSSLSNTPYQAADEIDLVATPSPSTKALASINEGEAYILVQLEDVSRLIEGKGLGAITTK